MVDQYLRLGTQDLAGIIYGDINTPGGYFEIKQDGATSLTTGARKDVPRGTSVSFLVCFDSEADAAAFMAYCAPYSPEAPDFDEEEGANIDLYIRTADWHYRVWGIITRAVPLNKEPIDYIQYCYDVICYLYSPYSEGEGQALTGVAAGNQEWTIRASAADIEWSSVCYGNGLFVAVAYSGTGNRVMTSPDGINWTIRASAADIEWSSVCYGNGLFVAVAFGEDELGNHVMTSPDGINWTIRASAYGIYFDSVCYGNGLFVAVSYGTVEGDQIMTSPDGVNWIKQSSEFYTTWNSVCYGNGLFVAVASAAEEGSKHVMTSPNGIDWTQRASAAADGREWSSVCYGNGLFVAVAYSGTGNRVMTSPDGINWTIRTSAADIYWKAVCYGDGGFVAVATTGTGNRVMTSPDGINWTIRASAADNAWVAVCYGDGVFVAVATTGTGNRVMTAQPATSSDVLRNQSGHLTSAPDVAVTCAYSDGHAEDVTVSVTDSESLVLCDEALSGEIWDLRGNEGRVLETYEDLITAGTVWSHDWVGSGTFDTDHMELDNAQSAYIRLSGPHPSQKPVKMTADLSLDSGGATGLAYVEISSDHVNWITALTQADFLTGVAEYVLQKTEYMTDIYVRIRCASGTAGKKVNVGSIKFEVARWIEDGAVPVVAAGYDKAMPVSATNGELAVAGTFTPRRKFV